MRLYRSHAEMRRLDDYYPYRSAGAQWVDRNGAWLLPLLAALFAASLVCLAWCSFKLIEIAYATG